MHDRILTSEQVAEILQVHPFTILKYIKQGKLKGSKLGRMYRIRESDVESFLNKQASTNESSASTSQQKKEKKSVSATAASLSQKKSEQASSAARTDSDSAPAHVDQNFMLE